MATITVPVLDHGFITLRNVSGPTRRATAPFDASDRDPAEAARMSFGRMNDDRTVEQDLALSRYLLEHWHTSPFEQIQVWIEMKMPIFVARQFVRHRTARLNEISGRYITLPEEFYIPDVVRGKAASNKQGSEDNLSDEVKQVITAEMQDTCERAFRVYKEMLDRGVAPEHARLVLPLNTYTHWLWNQDLHNIMHLLHLRLGEGAQDEAQQYAKAILGALTTVLPETVELFKKYRLGANNV